MDICFLYLLHWSVDIISAKTRHCQTGVRAADNRNIQPDGKHPGIKIAIGVRTMFILRSLVVQYTHFLSNFCSYLARI